MLRDLDINTVPRRFRPAVHRVVFRRRDHAEILGIIALQPGYKSDAHATCQERIFAVSFLSSSPARIAKDIDIRRPKIQSFHDVAPAGLYCLLVFRASLRPNHDGHIVDERVVKSRGESDGFWKDCCGAGICDPVQRLAPPVVCRNLQFRDSACLVHQLGGLLFERHPLNQVIDALIDGLRRIQIQRTPGLSGRIGDEKTQENGDLE